MSELVFQEFSPRTWSVQRKIGMSILLTIFVAVCSLFIGIGIFDSVLGHQLKYQPVNRDTILKMLAQDPNFYQVIKQQLKQKECINTQTNLRIIYTKPLYPIDSDSNRACEEFVATHPTGVMTNVNVKVYEQSRSMLSSAISKKFSYVQADLFYTKNRQLSKFVGVMENVATTVYIVDLGQRSVVIQYAPTSPTIDKSVELLAKNLESL